MIHQHTFRWLRLDGSIETNNYISESSDNEILMTTNLCVNRSCGMTNVRSAAGRECSHNISPPSVVEDTGKRKRILQFRL